MTTHNALIVQAAEHALCRHANVSAQHAAEMIGAFLGSGLPEDDETKVLVGIAADPKMAQASAKMLAPVVRMLGAESVAHMFLPPEVAAEIVAKALQRLEDGQ